MTLLGMPTDFFWKGSITPLAWRCRSWHETMFLWCWILESRCSLVRYPFWIQATMHPPKAAQMWSPMQPGNNHVQAFLEASSPIPIFQLRQRELQAMWPMPHCIDLRVRTLSQCPSADSERPRRSTLGIGVTFTLFRLFWNLRGNSLRKGRPRAVTRQVLSRV